MAARPLVAVDPPYERVDDADRAAKLVADVTRQSPRAVIAVWVPIKDLAGLDTMVGDIHDAARGAPVILAEARLRPLSNPLTMNGSAMILVNATGGHAWRM